MSMNTKRLGVIVIAVFIAGIGGTMLFNLWNTTSERVPLKLSSGEFAGEYDPGDIRGASNFGTIAEFFEIPTEILLEAYGLPEDTNPAAFQAKNLEAMYGDFEHGEIGTDSVKVFVSLYTGIPHNEEEHTLLPEAALEIIAERHPDTDLTQWEERTVSMTILAERVLSYEPETEEEHEEGELAVKGRTTFGDLRTWGFSDKEIEEALGIPPEKDSMLVRDSVVKAGINFSEAREAVQAVLERKLEGE